MSHDDQSLAFRFTITPPEATHITTRTVITAGGPPLVLIELGADATMDHITFEVTGYPFATVDEMLPILEALVESIKSGERTDLGPIDAEG